MIKMSLPWTVKHQADHVLTIQRSFVYTRLYTVNCQNAAKLPDTSRYFSNISPMQCRVHLHDGEKLKCSQLYNGMDKSHTPVHSSHLISPPVSQGYTTGWPNLCSRGLPAPLVKSHQPRQLHKVAMTTGMAPHPKTWWRNGG